MLHDNFPTNIFSISELSTFGYTRYSHTCSTRQFARQLNADSWSRSVSRSRPTSALNSTPSQPNNSNNNNQPLHHHTHDGHPIHASAAGSAGQGGGGGEAIHSLQEYDPLLAAYISLLTARVPCHWRYSDKLRENGNGSNSRDRSNVVERELWVFWLNDQSLLQNHGLEKLKECQSGIMTWDAILQYNTPGFVNTPQTPRSATHPSMFAADHHVPNSNQEYEMFMCGLRNVLDRGLVVKAGYRLGESYVFPASIQPKLDDSILPSYPKLPSLTMMSCTVTMYLSSSNLVVQPTFQYHRLRTLDVEDIDSRQSSEKELSVLLSPHGTTAVLKLNAMSEFTEEQTQKCLDAWEQLFGTNQEHASNLARSLPRLVSVSIKAGNSEVLLQYPTERVFVPVSCKDSPSDVGQLDGMGSRNAGFIEDLGAKFALWSWQEMTKNAIESPAVPKLVQSLADHAPVLAEPKNRIKTGSFAWNQQNQQQIQQQQQQHQQQQQQQRQQASFLQQQQDALAKRDSSDTNKIDYWFYTDPHSYLTSIVLNSCANAEPKTADSPSAADTQLNVVAPSTPAKSSSSKPKVKAKTNGTTESDGWIRRKPKRNAVTSSSFIHTGAAEAPSSSTSAWNGDPDSSAAPASYPDTTEQFNGNNSNNDSKGDTAQTDTQNAPAAASNTSSYPLELQSDASYMMPGLMGSNSMMGLYGGSTDDFDFDEVNDDDFSYFEVGQYLMD
ncbi:hypothetical protein BGX31_007731 [Mortierella sp. GBA43]|nr:hypothetical protein BGX31_007731 [Mortierella sp. GBA43]